MAKVKNITFEIEENGLIDIDKFQTKLNTSNFKKAQRQILLDGAIKHNEIINLKKS